MPTKDEMILNGAYEEQILEAIRWNVKHDAQQHSTMYGISKMIGLPETEVERYARLMRSRELILIINGFYYEV